MWVHCGGAEILCDHEHTDACYREIVNCLHEHTEECYPIDEENEDYRDEEATPSNAEEAEPTECGHICDWESGCIVTELICTHEHDEKCVLEEDDLQYEADDEQKKAEDGELGDSEPEEDLVEEATPSDALEEELEGGCICTERCTEEKINEDCPVCGTEDADLELCEGEYVAEKTLMALAVDGDFTVTFDGEITGYTTLTNAWSAAQNAATTADNRAVVQMNADYKGSTTSGYLVVKSGDHIVLDLNGWKVNRNRSSAYSSGYAILVEGGGNFTLEDSSTDIVEEQGTVTGGYITKGKGGGAGVRVKEGATFTMNGGNITGNKSYDGGAGVENKGTFIMNGGSIAGNTMRQGSTSGNGGGGVCNYRATFVMNGGIISGNTAAGSGGGVFNFGEFTMNDGQIINNTTELDGGGVANMLIAESKSTFTMNDGEIGGNHAVNCGGGVLNQGSFYVDGGRITENTAQWGGGVYSEGNDTTIDGAEISGNTAVNPELFTELASYQKLLWRCDFW